MSEQHVAEQKQRTANTRWTEEQWQAYVQANQHRPDFDPWLTPAQVENDPRFWGESRPNRLTTWQDKRYEYDTWGNCIHKISGSQQSRCKQSYEWDAGHQLSKVFIERFSNNQWHTEGWGYDYDPFGRRLAKYPFVLQTEKEIANTPSAARPWKSLEATYYCWDGQLLAIEQTGKQQQLYVYEPESFVPLALVKSEGELRHVSELDEALKDYPLEWQQLQHEHPEQWAEVLAKQNKYRRQAGVAELTVKPKTPTNQRIYYYHVDHLGTPQELTDQTGNIVWSAQYKAWGKVQTIEQPQICIQEQHGSALTERWVEPEQIEQPLRFQGQYYDQETGLHYNRFRYYDPGIGRFISQDPIGLMGGFNLYQYAPNPVVWIDPFGLAKTVRRTQTTGDADAGSARAARRETMRRHNIPTSKSYHSVLIKDGVDASGRQMYLEKITTGGRNTSGSQNIGEIGVHPEGHNFPATDNIPPTYEKPHYHGINGDGHISYDSGKPRSSNKYKGQDFKC